MVSIILVNYFLKEHLKKCLESIKKNKGVDFEIIIVNNSPEESLQKIKSKNPGIKIINAKNLGYGGGCNLGAEKSKGEYLVFLNPDSIVDEDWLREAIKVIKTKKAGIVMSKITSLDGKIVNSWGGEVHYTGFSWAGGFGEKNIIWQKPYEVASASGASLFIGQKLFQKLGGFDSDFFMYVEDLDLSFRARLLGHKILCAPRSIIFHDYEFKKGDYKLYYLERNRHLFVLKNYSLKMIFLILPAVLFLDLGLWGYFFLIGKPGIKVRATFDFWKNYFKTIRKRKKIQEEKVISDKKIVKFFSSKIRFKAIDNFWLKYFFNPLFEFNWFLISIFF